MKHERAARVATPGPILDLDRHVPYFLTNISSRFSRGASQLYLRHYGIGITEWRVLAVIAAMSNVSANQICAAVGLDKAAVSRGLRELDRLKLLSVVDDPSDRRSSKASLNAAGRRLHDAVIAVALERERILLATLSPTELEVLIVALRKIRAQVAAANAFEPASGATPSVKGGPGR